MKLEKGKISYNLKYNKVHHIKNISEDINNLSDSQNCFISKVFKYNNLQNENLPNLKKNIQNIFSNDDNRQKAIQYLLKIRNSRNSSPSTDFQKILSSASSHDDKSQKKEREKEIITNNNNYNNINQEIIKPIITSYDLSQKNFDIRPMNKVNRNDNKNKAIRISNLLNKFITEDDENLYNNNNFLNYNKVNLINNKS